MTKGKSTKMVVHSPKSPTIKKTLSQTDSVELIKLFNAGNYTELESRTRALLQHYPDSGFAWKVLGTALKAQGKDAVSTLQQATHLLPDDAEAHNSLAIALQDSGRIDEAVVGFRRAVQIKAGYADAHNNLGSALKALGKIDAAVTCYRHALALKPDYAQVHSNLGVALKALGQIDNAAASYRRALAIKPDYADAYYNLGIALQELGQDHEAVQNYTRALAIKPDYVEAYRNLGIAQNSLGQLDAAVTSYGKALQIKPDFAEVHSNLGVALTRLGQLDSAVRSCRQALAIKPGYADAHYNLGNALQKLGRNNLAAESYRNALHIKPDYAEAQCNLGIVLRNLDHYDESVASYRRALAIKSDFAEAHYNLGIVLQDIGQLDEAAASYRRALAIRPRCLAYAVRAYLLLPTIIPGSGNATAYWRERYKTGLSTLLCGDFDDHFSGELAELNQLSFHLAYHHENDKPLMQALHDVFRGPLSSMIPSAPSVPAQEAAAVSNRRVKVGFLSEYLVRHTIGKLFQGLILHLDRSRFEVVVIHAPKSKRDAMRQAIDAMADKVVTLPANLIDQQSTVLAEHLDVLFYPDIGMSTATYFLAYARLAPVQAVSWGHPDTTGIASMDYFVSADTIEPPGADEHYAERLVRLNRMPCHYQSPHTPIQILSRQALGLPETGILYACPQSLFKLHPDFDAVLAAIAAGDPNGTIILIEGLYPSWTNLLKSRWAINYPALLERVIFLPSMSHERFMSLIAHSDILLDPIYFGSGNTMYEAMLFGTPIVTWPGKFMRGRIVAGGYQQMGIEDPPVAEGLEEYAKLALALGLDPERRSKLRTVLRQAADKELFCDMRAVREFECFLTAAVDAARCGEILPIGWSP